MSLPKRKKSRNKVINPFKIKKNWKVSWTPRPGPYIIDRFKSTYVLYKETRKVYTNYINLLKTKTNSRVPDTHLLEPLNLPKRHRHYTKPKKKSISRIHRTTKRKLRQGNRHRLYLINRERRFASFRVMEFLNKYNQHHHKKGYNDWVLLVNSKSAEADIRKTKEKLDYFGNVGYTTENNLQTFLKKL